MVFKKITLFSFIFGIFTILIILRSFDLGNMYKISQFVITYEYGYIKRALIPSIFFYLGNDLNSQGVSNFFLFLHLLIIIFLYLFFIILTFKKKFEFKLIIFIILAYSHSGFIQHYIYDLVRLDIFNLIYFSIFIISLIIKNIYFNLLTFTISTILIFLTHEAGILVHLPAMCFFMYLLHFSRIKIKIISI